jgi:hypothetical protein
MLIWRGFWGSGGGRTRAGDAAMEGLLMFGVERASSQRDTVLRGVMDELA